MSDIEQPLQSSEPTAAPDERPVLLEARGVTKVYKTGAGPLHVLRGVDLQVREGEILAILGTSGCGKSTLLHVLGWLDEVDEGQILFEGKDRAALPAASRAELRNRVMRFVFQFYHLMPELTAVENVSLPAMIKHGGFGQWAKQHSRSASRAKALLALVGLQERMEHKPRQLSGGERQRVAIARALMNEPRFLFCDEPTGNLDGRTAEDVRRLLWDLNERSNQTMVIVTHDAQLAHQADRIVYLEEGRVVTKDEIDVVEEVDLG